MRSWDIGVSVQSRKCLRVTSMQNIKTATWLRRYVYERVFLSKGRPTPASLAVTQVVSLLWHGLDVGYLTMFASSIFYLEAGKVTIGQGEATATWPRSIFLRNICLFEIKPVLSLSL